MFHQKLGSGLSEKFLDFRKPRDLKTLAFYLPLQIMRCLKVVKDIVEKPSNFDYSLVVI